MLSKILTLGLSALGLLASQSPIASDSALQTGFYEIHNKAYDGQLAAFYRDELILVLNNATAPKSPNFGKWKVKEVVPDLYSITNVGLGLGLLPDKNNFLVAGRSEILYSITDAGDDTFTIFNPEEDDQYWTQYSYCEAEVHLDPAMDADEQRGCARGLCLLYTSIQDNSPDRNDTLIESAFLVSLVSAASARLAAAGTRSHSHDALPPLSLSFLFSFHFPPYTTGYVPLVPLLRRSLRTCLALPSPLRLAPAPAHAFWFGDKGAPLLKCSCLSISSLSDLKFDQVSLCIAIFILRFILRPSPPHARTHNSPRESRFHPHPKSQPSPSRLPAAPVLRGAILCLIADALLCVAINCGLCSAVTLSVHITTASLLLHASTEDEVRDHPSWYPRIPSFFRLYVPSTKLTSSSSGHLDVISAQLEVLRQSAAHPAFRPASALRSWNLPQSSKTERKSSDALLARFRGPSPFDSRSVVSDVFVFVWLSSFA
ncbi:hypothetical protein C8R45DRAFT_1133501 [Mycena sanguinolenta]|nr:hypothetical protein C8R45DRAFT_1133501 [Mycena sanguinolenta]